MDAKKRPLCRTLWDLHQDEGGMELISVVVIIALSSLALLFVKLVIWPMIKGMAEQHDNELRNLP